MTAEDDYPFSALQHSADNTDGSATVEKWREMCAEIDRLRAEVEEFQLEAWRAGKKEFLT